jgi:transposase
MLYSIGIDIGKREHHLVILDDTGQRAGKPQTITNTRRGFDSCLLTLRALDGTIQVALEATGPYWLALYEYLTHAEFSVAVFNPLQVHAYRKTGVRRTKTDRVDAFWIADLLRIGGATVNPQPDGTILQLRELARFRWQLIDQIGDNKRKVLNVLDRVFPEYETLFSDVFLVSSRTLLKQAANADEFAAFDLGELTTLLHTHSRGRFGLAHAQKIVDTAKTSIGVSFLADAAQLEVACLVSQIEFLQTQVEQVDAALAALLTQVPQHLTTIPGLGLVTAATVLGEIGDVTRFATLEKLVAYAGIDATVHQSGQFNATQMHMSKRGSPYLRRALWLSAFVASQHDAELQTYYERKRAEGKHHNTVVGAICRKLLARIFVVLKEQRPYEVRSGAETA